MPTVARFTRNEVRGAFRLFKAAAIALAVFLIVSFFVFRIDGGNEFHHLPGAAAKDRLGENWPASIDPNSVASVSYKFASTIDSCSSWFRIELDEASASIWAEAAHSDEEEMARSHYYRDRPVEGVRRVVPGPPPLHRQTGSTPTWWSPPAADCRATEFMAWYQRYDSGVGWALYSVFDPSTKTLWIYSNSAQHDLLWRHGELPAGRPIPGLKQNDAPTPSKPNPPRSQ
ncbi:MAG TPA: hypothetical protein VGP63_30210 [Planctomycetaceae bacterium]|nr:hypothetical protein [Planctomycetaceae bacterium]